jgi:hypothetical protein
MFGYGLEVLGFGFNSSFSFNPNRKPERKT